MNTNLKIGLAFQAIQFAILIGAGLTWLLLHLDITFIGIAIFLWIGLNIGSLILIINGAMQPKENKNRFQ